MALSDNLIGGIASGASGLFGSVASIINTNKTNKANKAMAEYQYSKDLESWNRQNAYNSPSAQMERYQSAGLNPNLIYGTGSASAGNATQLPKYQAPSMQYHYEAPNIAPTLGAYTDMRAKNAQIQSINEDVTNKRLQNQILTANLYDIISGNRFKNLNYQNLWEQGNSNVTIKTAEAENADKYYVGRGEASMQQGAFMKRMLEQQLKNSLMANTLQGKSLEKYSAEIAGANLSNEYKSMQNKWYGTAGIHSASDVVPFIKMLFGR